MELCEPSYAPESKNVLTEVIEMERPDAKRTQSFRGQSDVLPAGPNRCLLGPRLATPTRGYSI